MSPYEKIKKQKSGLSLIIVLLIVFSMFTIPSFIFKGDTVVQASYGGYTKYKCLTIESDYISTSLENFPVWVHNISSDFVDIDDVAFVDYSNLTRFPHEIEVLNATSGEIGIWVNVTSISNTADTHFNMYYNTSGGTASDYLPQQVWDEYFVFVSHMNGSGDYIYDSTLNQNHGLKIGDVVECEGLHGYAQDFPGTSDFINMTYDGVGFGGQIADTDLVTYEGWGSTENAGHRQTMFYGWNGGANAEQFGGIWFVDNSSLFMRTDKDANNYDAITYPMMELGWQRLSGTFDGDYINVSLNKTLGTTLAADGMNGEEHWNCTIGCYASGSHEWTGIIDEFRVSNISRNESWMDASFDTVNESLNLGEFISFSTESSQGQSSFQLVGLVGNTLTWSGTSGTSVWCNSSGTVYETMNISMVISDSDNVTEIRVWVGDTNDTDYWINASNISVMFSSDNTTWDGGGTGNVSTFTDGGSNVTINQTTWTEANGMYGTSPFAGAGLTDKNASIYCRFRLDIPTANPSDMYYNSDAWYVYIGYVTE